MKIAVIISLCFIACGAPVKEPMKFDKSGWNDYSDGIYLYREQMLNDLIENHKLKGLTYHQLVDLLGKPDGYDETVYYEVVVEYGSNIDPVYVKSLLFDLQDSVVSRYEVKEHGERP